MSWRHEQWTRRLQPRLLGYASVAGLLALTTLLSLTLPSSRAGQHNISSKRPAADKGADGASASLQTARNVGKAYYEQGKYPEAIAEFKKVMASGHALE